jgi:integrase
VKWMRRAQRKACLMVDGKIHKLRHTYGARLATAGAVPSAIQALMGHAHLTTTLRYLHLAKGATKAALALLDRDENGAVDGTMMEPKAG